MDYRQPSARITASFNFALFLYIAACGLVRFLFSVRNESIPLDAMLLSAGLDLARVVVVFCITTYFVREIWNRLITQLCTSRQINTQEALALVLAVAMLAS